jgi:hypothetical protein
MRYQSIVTPAKAGAQRLPFVVLGSRFRGNDKEMKVEQ